MDLTPVPSSELSTNANEAAREPNGAGKRKREKKLPFSLYQQGPAGIWHFSKMVKGRREKASLHTPDRALAEARGWDKFNNIMADKFELVDRQAARAGWARLSEIEAAYLANPLVIANEHTRRRNWNDLEVMIREVEGPAVDCTTLSSEVISKRLAYAFFQGRVAAAKKNHASDLLALESAKRAAIQTFAHARSVFSARAMEGYGSLKLPVGVKEFVSSPKVQAKKQPKPKRMEDGFVAGVIEAAALLRVEDPAVWVTFWLMIGGGFRNVEVLHARKGWFVREQWGWRVNLELREDFMPKGSEGEVVLPLDVMDAIMTLERPDDFLVPAKTKSERHEAIYRRLNVWLEAHGVEEEAGKRAYRLRKYFVEMVRRQLGRAAAQVAARHASGRTTEDHYLSAHTMERPIDFPVAATKNPAGAGGVAAG